MFPPLQDFTIGARLPACVYALCAGGGGRRGCEGRGGGREGQNGRGGGYRGRGDRRWTTGRGGAAHGCLFLGWLRDVPGAAERDGGLARTVLAKNAARLPARQALVPEVEQLASLPRKLPRIVADVAAHFNKTFRRQLAYVQRAREKYAAVARLGLESVDVRAANHTVSFIHTRRQ